jgi:hypothetical protein
MNPKRNFLSIFGLSMAGLILGLAALAGNGMRVLAASTDPGQLCTLAVQMDSPDRCGAVGASAMRVQYWERGLLPRRPMPVQPTDSANLGKLQRDYYVIGRTRSLPLYSTMLDAVAGKPTRTMEKGLVYISAQSYAYLDGQTLIYTGNKYFVRKKDVSQIFTQIGQFHGVESTEAPVRSFGWVKDTLGVHVSNLPGKDADLKAQKYPWRTLVEVFDSSLIAGETWYEIGLGQWVRQASLHLITLQTGLPDKVPPDSRWIYVDLSQQTVSAYEGTRLVFATLASTGENPYYTRPGLFQVTKKLDLQDMSGSFTSDRSDYYFVGDVPWVMYFDRARALHGAYWHNNFGTPRSHGCVNLSDADAHWLYNWADLGTWVYVVDPSGKTPTDDNYYKDDAGSP